MLSHCLHRYYYIIRIITLANLKKKNANRLTIKIQFCNITFRNCTKLKPKPSKHGVFARKGRKSRKGESGRAQLGPFESAKLKWKKKIIFLFTDL